MAAFLASIGHSDSLQHTKGEAGIHYLPTSELNLDDNCLALHIFYHRSQSSLLRLILPLQSKSPHRYSQAL